MAPRDVSVDRTNTPDPVIEKGFANVGTLRIGVKAFVEKDGEKRKAEILSIQTRKGQPHYYVHYEEFNKRLDEWVPFTRLDLSQEVEWPQPEQTKKAPKAGATQKTTKTTAGQKRPYSSSALKRELSPSGGSGSLTPTTGNQTTVARPTLAGGKENSRNGSSSDLTVLVQEVSDTPKDTEDLDVMDVADAAAAAKAGTNEQGLYSREEEIEKLRTSGSMTQNQTEISRVRNLSKISMGKFEIEPWYFSPYPLPLTEVDLVYICEFCLGYHDSKRTFERHRAKCTLLHPPGNEIYRDENVSFFEIDGRRQRTWCRNLCLLSKLFLDHKTLYFDVDPFLFYCMAIKDATGYHLVGYFSKEKDSAEGYNVACILTLPQYQRKGYGNLLMAFSYELSKRENKLGSPEKPLSDLGLLGYRAYWQETIVNVLTEYEQQKKEISVEEISSRTAMTTEDVLHTFINLNMLRYSVSVKPKHLAANNLKANALANCQQKRMTESDVLFHQKNSHVIVLTDAVLAQKQKLDEKEKLRGKRRIDAERIQWKPPVFSASSRTWNW